MISQSTGACGACGNDTYVDGSAFRGRDASFDWAREYFGNTVGYVLEQPDGSSVINDVVISPPKMAAANADFVETGSVPKGFAYVQREILRILGAEQFAGQNNEFRILRTNVDLINDVESAALTIFRLAQTIEKWRLDQLADPQSNPVIVGN